MASQSVARPPSDKSFAAADEPDLRLIPVRPFELEHASLRAAQAASAALIYVKEADGDLSNALAMLCEYLGELASDLSGMHQRHERFHVDREAQS